MVATYHLNVKVPMFATGANGLLRFPEDMKSGLLSGLGEYPKAHYNSWKLTLLEALLGLEFDVEAAIFALGCSTKI